MVSVAEAGTGQNGPDPVLNTIFIGGGTAGVVVSSDGGTAYVVNSPNGTVDLIDTVTGHITVPGGDGVNGIGDTIAISPDGTQLYLTDLERNTLSTITLATATVTPGA